MKKLIVLASLIVSSVFSLSQAEVQYTITDLGTLGSDPQSKAYGINDFGQVVGYSGYVQGPEAGRRAFLWDNETMTDLGTLGGDHSEAYDINNDGKIVGRSTLDSSEADVRGFLWENSSMSNLGTLADGWTEAHGINNVGQVVGSSVSSTSVDAFSWKSGLMNNLGSLSDHSRGYSVNDAGQMVGYSFSSTSFNTTACLWDNGSIIPLGSIDSTLNYAWDINNSGQIVGRSGNHAFLWENDGMIDLGNGIAKAINDSGQIVGSFGLWENWTVTSLSDLLGDGSAWLDLRAEDINNAGQIVGSGLTGGEVHAFLMTPVPEPAIIQVSVDIKPGSCPNPLRVNFIGKGVYPVAIIGEAGVLDVTTIDENTATLEGVAALRGKVGDVNQDGVGDLVLKFDRQAILDALEVTYGDLAELPNREVLTLTLFAESTAGLVSGTDTLVILNRGAIKRKK